MYEDDQEYVVAPWGTGDCETADLMIELPSRELVAHVEVPTAVLDRMAQLSDDHGIPVAQTLAERLEINRARLSVSAAKSAETVVQVQTHLTDARDYLSGVEELDTADLEAEIDRVWSREIESA